MIFPLFLLWFACTLQTNGFLDPDSTPVEVMEVRNDAVTIIWKLPEDVAAKTTHQALVIAVVRSSSSPKSSTVRVGNNTRTYTFTGLVGNTTYRTSVESFKNNTSLWYASNMVTTSLASLNWLPCPTNLVILDKTSTSLEVSWTAPTMIESGHNAIINQHLLNVYEFFPDTKQFSKKFSINIPVPKTTYIIPRLSPGSVYNITLQAGTSYGYGNLAWSVFSTLDTNGEFVLKLGQKTPNTLTLTWTPQWLPSPNSKFTVRAKTLHSPDNVEKEILNSEVSSAGRVGEYVLRHLHPGSTYNVSISTALNKAPRQGSSWADQIVYKTAWGVFSTLTQGEYVVAEPRLVVETDSAASFVFQPLRFLEVVTYQMRYIPNDGEKPTETYEYTEDELKCPKFGCEWLCLLLFNLPRRPREYAFEVRAKVDGLWNKWTPVDRKPWNLLERVCSVNPPTALVEHVGAPQFQREIDISSANTMTSIDPWRYLVVVDSRQSDFSAIDMSKLADRATSDYDHTPYYITASLTPQQVHSNIDFRLGDSRVHGGYLNYPLRESLTNPRWTLIPVSKTENEIMEPRIKTCGFKEQGSFECEMSIWKLIWQLPWWFATVLILILAALIFSCCVLAACVIRNVCENPNQTKESSVMYYHNDSPNTMSMTREYRKVEKRQFKHSDVEERRRFMEEDTGGQYAELPRSYSAAASEPRTDITDRSSGLRM